MIKNYLATTCILTYAESFEHMIIKLNIEHNIILLSAVYLSPVPQLEWYYKYLEQIQEEISKIKSEAIEMILLGDFNCLRYTWSFNNNQLITEGFSSHKSVQEGVAAMCCELNKYELKQYNEIKNSNGALLDLVFAGNNNNISLSKCLDPLILEDLYHPALNIQYEISKFNFTQYNHKFFNYHKANYALINNNLQYINWNDKFGTNLDVDQIIDKFYDVLNNTIEKNVPKTYEKQNTYAQWFTPELKESVIEKKIAHKKYKEALDAIPYVHSDCIQCKIEFNRLRA